MNNIKISNGGRSTSQISIYDYPEHLNPFYEDENHKRIRFWHIGKNNKNYNNGENSRRGSFSLSGIKEMWAFKSFRLKKKSSTLGINKTSESPPPLRRELISDNTNHYGTYDPRMRHTVGNNTLNENFLRNTPYRASLQDMRYVQKMEHNNNGIGFERNNQYRSTIQTTRSQASNGLSPRRYVYGGSLTPQPRLRSNDDYNNDYSNGSLGISRGSSQLSIASKNPFEEDNDDVVIGKISDSQSGGTEQRKRHIRKKRRAPPPPVPIPKIITEEPQITENNQNSQEENKQITNLAVEIQNFVKSIDDETVENKESTQNLKNSTIKEEENVSHNLQIEINDSMMINEDSKRNKNTDENSLQIVENSTECNENSTKNIEENSQNKEEQSNIEENLLSKTSCLIEEKENKLIQNLSQKNLNITEENSNDDDDKNKEEQQGNENKNEIENNTISTNNICSSPCNDVDTDDDKSLEQKLSYSSYETASAASPNTEYNSIELKITESVEDLSEKSQKSEISNEVIKEIEYVPLKNTEEEEEEEKEINLNDKITNNNNDINQTTRHRSVREIIESINRNQKLLKINQIDNTSNNIDNNDFNNKEENIQAPPRIKNKFKTNNNNNNSDISKNNESLESTTQKFNNNDNDNDFVILSNDILEKLSDKINNDNNNNNSYEIFEKCKIKKNNNKIDRETSPTSSNLDWNPVPKPKRTKKLSIDLQQKYDQTSTNDDNDDDNRTKN